MTEKPILFMLLDIDGVLLEAHGYRLACIDTINDFLVQMGQPGLSVDRAVTDAYEAGGISAEWDMVPLTLAAFVNWYGEQTGSVLDDGIFPPDCSSVPLMDQDAFTNMLRMQIKEYCGVLDPGLNVIDAVRLAYENGRASGLRNLRGTALWDRFFTETLNPECSPYFRQLMCRIIGSEAFESFYGMQAPVRCEPYLVTKDVPLISEYYRNLLPEIAGKTVFPVIMTYRPTRLPHWDGNKKALYYVNTPDGECAQELLGWSGGRIPMIGSGSLCYIEDKYGLRREFYVKPHPFHALASMLRTICAEETEALEVARLLCESDPKKDPDPASKILPRGKKIILAVFEDSFSGIQCTKNAADVLAGWGYDVETRLCGIRSTEAKSQRIKDAGVKIYPDVNAAFDVILAEFERDE